MRPKARCVPRYVSFIGLTCDSPSTDQFGKGFSLLWVCFFGCLYKSYISAHTQPSGTLQAFANSPNLLGVSSLCLVLLVAHTASLQDRCLTTALPPIWLQRLLEETRRFTTFTTISPTSKTRMSDADLPLRRSTRRHLDGTMFELSLSRVSGFSRVGSDPPPPPPPPPFFSVPLPKNLYLHSNTLIQMPMTSSP